MRLWVLPLFLLVSCNTDIDAKPPYSISVRGIPQRHIDYLNVAINNWNLAVGDDFLLTTKSKSPDIRVKMTPKCEPGHGRSASAVWDPKDIGDCTICFHDEYNPNFEMSMFMHEIGHCLGFGHDTEINSVMNENTRPVPEILQRHVDRVLSLIVGDIK